MDDVASSHNFKNNNAKKFYLLKMSKIPKIIEQMKSEFNLRTTIWKIKINFHAKLMYLILIQVDTYKNIVHSLPEARNGYKYMASLI